MRCSFCGDNIDPDMEGYWVHDNGETRHEECGNDVAKEEPQKWLFVEEGEL